MYGARWWQLDKVFRLALAKCEVGVGGHTSSHVPGIIDWNALVSRDSVTVLRPRTFSEASTSRLLSSRHPPPTFRSVLIRAPFCARGSRPTPS